MPRGQGISESPRKNFLRVQIFDDQSMGQERQRCRWQLKKKAIYNSSNLFEVPAREYPRAVLFPGLRVDKILQFKGLRTKLVYLAAAFLHVEGTSY